MSTPVPTEPSVDIADATIDDQQTEQRLVQQAEVVNSVAAVNSDESTPSSERDVSPFTPDEAVKDENEADTIDTSVESPTRQFFVPRGPVKPPTVVQRPKPKPR